MTSLVATVLFRLKVPGGIEAAIGQTSTDCIMEDNMILLPTESIGSRFEDSGIY